jgi:hypothetical protein
MGRGVIKGFALALAVCASFSATSAEPNIEELVISGKTIYEMRRDIVKAEDRFYALYNKLNTETLYDMHCAMEAPTGARIDRRTCRAEYYDRALEDESRAMLQGHAAPPANLIFLMRQADYRKNMLKVVSDHPELFALLKERVELQQRYERELKQRRADRAAKKK